MKITDAPFAAGTPEHGEWVRGTLLPHLALTTSRGPHLLGSSESQGRQVIVGGAYDIFDEDGNVTHRSLIEVLQLAEEAMLRQLMPSWVSLSDVITAAQNKFTVFMEEFKALSFHSGDLRASSIIWDDPPPVVPRKTPQQIVDECLDPLKSVPVGALEEIRSPLAGLAIRGVSAANESWAVDVPPWREPWRR